MSPETFKINTRRPPLWILILMISFPSVSAVLFTPSIPGLIKRFGIANEAAQFTVTLFLIGYALGQLIYGPLSNKLGRKPTIFIGVFIAILGNVLAILSSTFESFNLLLWGRLISALGSSVGLVLTFIVINDFYYARQARKVVPYVSLSFAVVPFLGVTLGGYLTQFLGWESCFYFLAAYSVLIFLAVTYLPETGLDLDAHALKFRNVWGRFKKGFTDPRLVLYAMLFGSTTSMIYIYAGFAPLIVIRHLNIQPDMYGLLNLIISAGYISGNVVAAKMSHKISGRSMIKIGMTIILAALLVFAVLFLSGVIHILAFYLPFFFVFFGIPMSYSNAAVLATQNFMDRPTGSAVMNFINMTLATLGVLIIGSISVTPRVILPIFLLGVFVFMAFIFYLSRKYSEES